MEKNQVSVEVDKNKTKTKNDNKFYDFDVILKEIGSLEKYQLFLFLVVFWISIPSGKSK